MSNMVVCPEPLAAQVGQEIFAIGGNAVDVAVAVTFAQAVTNPLLCGLGGSSLLYLYDGKTQTSVVLNAEASIGSGAVPQTWQQEYIGRAETVGRYIVESEANQVGHQSVMVPGFVRGCWVAFQRFGSGRVGWTDLLAPSVRLAEEGFEVYPYIAAFWRSLDDRPGYPGLMTKLNATPDAARNYLKPDRSIFEQGDWLVQPELAETIQRLADTSGDDFYTGELARAIREDFAKHEGLIEPEDLEVYSVEDETSIWGSYRGLDIASSIAPSSGPQLVEMLQILEHFDLVALGHNTPAYIDLCARVQRATFADNVRLKGLSLKESGLLEQQVISPERAAHWTRRIKLGDRIQVRGGAVDSGTTHVTCIDANHNIVSCCHSIGSQAGAGVITPGLGFLYNNFLGHFNPLPGKPDSIAPGKRAGGSLPVIIFENDEPYIALGAPGGSRIVTSIAQSIVNVVDFGMDIKTAVSVPRFHSEEQQLVFLEPAFDERVAESVRVLGNEVQRSSYQARVQAIRLHADSGELEAGPDPRGGAGVGRYP